VQVGLIVPRMQRKASINEARLEQFRCLLRYDVNTSSGNSSLATIVAIDY
jgi:predicted double-glycine peptidase